ncbi:hypothetical protein EXIGLDRAFT_775723 [Exidia glandulosa HHB12029]|uniref:DUF7918 domain-containing protein n=1 Tax=Exidia glandulosa HHB12029 TaxID=1314781 RepID=A0A165DT14_EXIGL|nr:hypothetical protein EXIGLDRAFT_775723 [Exidia glandulosa HHB12029]
MPAQPTSISHSNFEAWVECDGKALPVYGVEVNGTKATCWIASQAGKAFSVHFKMHDTCEVTYSGRAYVDGIKVDGRVFRPHTRAECTFRDMNPTPTTRQKLYFSKLKTSAHLDGAKQFTVHETAKKLGGHHVTLGDPQVIAPYRRTTTRKIGEPIVEFQFKYRPQDVLEAQDIIPVSRALVAGPSKKEPKVQKRPRDEATPSARRSKRSKTVANEPSDEEALRAAQTRVQQLETQVALRAAQARIRELEAQLEADD